MTAESRLRGVLAGLLMFLVASGAVTWSQPRPALAIQYLQIAHMAVGFVVIALGLIYVALHLAQTVGGVGSSLRGASRAPFLALVIGVVGAWRSRDEWDAHILADFGFIAAGTCLLLAIVWVLGLGRAARLTVALLTVLAVFARLLLDAKHHTLMVLGTGVISGGILVWSVAKSSGSVTKTPGGLGGLAMLGCFIAALGGAGASSGLLLYVHLFDRYPIPWFVHVVSSWIALALVVAHIRSSRARSARVWSPPRRSYAWATPIVWQALPAFIASCVATTLLAVAGSARVASFELDGSALVPMDVGFSAVVPDTCESCHTDVVPGWAQSSHAHAANNPFFTSLLRRLRAERGPEALRFCLRCHAPHARDPVDASFESVVASEGYRAGVHCVSCHRAMPGGRGDGAFEVVPLGADAFSLLIDRPGVAGQLGRLPGARPLIEHMFISSHLARHRERYRFGTHDAATCTPCHVQTLGPPTHGRVTHVLQDQYASWQGSPAAGEGRTCTSCHMSYYRQTYDVPIQDHRFVAASTYVAGVARGAAGVNEVVASLAAPGSVPPAEGYDYDEAAPASAAPPDAGSAALLVMEAARVEDSLVIRTRNSGQIGHIFPTGPTDLFQVWLSVRAADERGRVVIDVGSRGPEGAPALGDRLFDADGEMIHDHRLWAVDKVVDLGRIPVVGTHEVRLDGGALECVDSSAACRFRVEAAWNYRRLDPSLVEALTGEPAPELPIVQVGKVSAEIPGRRSPGGS